MSITVKLKNKKALAGVVCALLTLFLLFGIISPRSGGPVDPLVGASNWGMGANRETGLGTYRVFTSADFKGGDLGFKEAMNLEECLYACDENKDCVYVSFVDKLCYLKDAPTSFELYSKRPWLFTAKRVSVKTLVSDRWHDAQVVATTKATYRIFDGYEFQGKSIKSLMQPNIDNCLRVCEDDPQCLFMTFDGQKCDVKTDKVKRVAVSGNKAIMKVKMQQAPDPLVKHHWTKGDRKITSNAIYQTWSGCQFVGNDINVVQAKNLEECLSECDKELFCQHVTLVGKECMLKGYAPEYFEVLPGRNDIWAAKQLESKRSIGDHRAVNTGLPPDLQTLKDLHSDYLVGEFYDEGDDYESKFSRYRLWEGLDFQGGDLHTNSITLDSYTLESCLEACDHNPECGFAMSLAGEGCWLKAHPFQMTRLTERRTETFAAMKLGRIGKSGLDANTVKRTSHGRPAPSFPILMPTDLNPGHVKTLGSFTLFLCLLVGLFGGVVYYWNRLQRAFYVNELA